MRPELVITGWHFVHYVVSLELVIVAGVLGLKWLALLAAWSLIVWALIVRRAAR
jgi:hypothetical protein